MTSLHELGDVLNQTISEVTNLVNRTGDRVAGILKGNVDLDSKANEPSPPPTTMGSGKSKHSSSTSLDPKKNVSTALVPPFSVAYGVNQSGKTALYPIDVAKELPDRNEHSLRVFDLQTVLASLTGVPVENQQLLYKGTHLNGEQLLVELKIRDGAKMMMLGRAPPDPDEETRKKLSAVEDEVSTASMEVQEAQIPLESESTLNEQIVKSCHKRLLHLNEFFMKLLMKVDAVEIDAERTEMRAKRKNLVTRVHTEMEVVDTLVQRCTRLLNVKNSPGSQKKFKSQEER